MNLGDLSFFMALARTRTMSAAGRSLGVKHTTVARRVLALEQQLGSRLFDRAPDGYFLSPAGENLYRYAVKIETLSNEAQRELIGMDSQLQGVLKLTAPYDFLSRVVASELQQFIHLYPHIELSLSCAPGLRDLASLEADVAIRLTPAPPENLVGKPVLPLRHGVYGSQHYLENQPAHPNVILWQSEDRQPPWVKDHFPNAHLVARTDDAQAMVALVKNHLGLARIPCYIGDSDPTLRRIDVDLIPSTWSVWILSHIDLRSTARVRVCREFLTDVIEKKRALVMGESSVYYHK